jgi:hypothetical protein
MSDGRLKRYVEFASSVARGLVSLLVNDATFVLNVYYCVRHN